MFIYKRLIWIAEKLKSLKNFQISARTTMKTFIKKWNSKNSSSFPCLKTIPTYFSFLLVSLIT